MEPLILPAGYGLSRATAAELRERHSLMDLLLMWEPPRTRGARRYVISADIGDGLGADRSVADVIRVGTVEEPQEQVAQFVSDALAPTDFANIIYAIGMLYRDQDGVEALAAVETNNHGLSTQDALQQHLQYAHFYTWEVLDARNPEDRFTKRIGWMTTNRTRPMILDKLYTALTTLDPITGLPDFVTHSPFLHEELKDFTKPPGGSLWEAEAARGCHDDCVMAAAIGNYVAYRLAAGEAEPVEERRRRRSEQQAQYADAIAQGVSGRPDWRNSPATAEEADLHGFNQDETEVSELLYGDRGGSHLYDPRKVDY